MLFNKSMICFMHYNIFSSFTVGSVFPFRLKRGLIIEKKKNSLIRRIHLPRIAELLQKVYI